MKQHLYNVIIDLCVVITAGVGSFIITLFHWLIIDFYCVMCYIIKGKGGKHMHKKNIFDLYNEQHTSPAADPAPGEVVKAEETQTEIIAADQGEASAEVVESVKAAEENAEKAEGSEEDA